MKPFLRDILSHFCFWRTLGNEIKFSIIKVFPLFIALAIPIIYPLVMSLTYSNQSVVERSAVVLDLDNSAISRDLVMSIDATQGVMVKRTVDDIEEGIQAIMSRQADSFIFIPEDFSSRIKRFEQGTVKIYVYATNMMLYASVLGGVQSTILDKNVELAIENVANPKGITGERATHTMDPIHYDQRMLYAPTLAYSSYLCPILFVLIFHQMALIIIGFTIGLHRELDEKFRKKKLWFIDIFWRYLWYLPFIFLGTFFVYYGYCNFFGWPNGTPYEMMKLIMLLVCCQIPLGIAIASLCYDRFSPFQYLLASSLLFFTLSGYVWPVFAMPDNIVPVLDYLGIEPAASAMRKITFKGADLVDCPREIKKLLSLCIIYTIGALIVVHRDLPLRPIKTWWAKHRAAKTLEASKDEAESSESEQTKAESDTQSDAV